MFDVRIIYIMFHYMHDLEHNIYYANMEVFPPLYKVHKEDR